MRVRSLDHLVLSVRDTDAALRFYHEVLGLELLRLEEFRRGEAPFPSVRVSEESIIDLVETGQRGDGRNVEHFCLIIEPTDMDKLADELRAKGVPVKGAVGRRWGARGWGLSLYVEDPEGNTVEMKCHPPGL